MSKLSDLTRAEVQEMLVLEELHELVPIVAHRAGTDAICLSNTALLVESAKMLGIPLRPVPVSLWTKTGVSDAASTGRRGREFGLTLTDQSRDLTIGIGDCYREVGHMVAVLDGEPSVLLGASFRQFSKFGLPDVPVPARIEVPQLADGVSWDVAFHANGTEVRIRYWPVEADTSWLVDHRNFKSRFESTTTTFSRSATKSAPPESQRSATKQRQAQRS